MDKKSPFFTASAASVIYFIIFLMLKFFMEKEAINWQGVQGALLGAIVFWIVIFAVHQFLRRRYSD